MQWMRKNGKVGPLMVQLGNNPAPGAPKVIPSNFQQGKGVGHNNKRPANYF